jgi:RES domain-containing protein
MIIYRLTNGDHIKDLSGNGSKLYGGRWNSIGLHAIYTTENVSLAILEILVHVKKYKRPLDYHLLTLSIPDNIKPVTIITEKLKKNWKDDPAYSQFIGDEFLKTKQSLFLKVPSAIVEQENNFILNPAHADATKIKIVSARLFEFDKRLYLTNE